MQHLPAKDDAIACTVVGTESGVSTASEVDGVWPSNSLVHETICPSIVSITIPPTCLGSSRRERPFLAKIRRTISAVRVSLEYDAPCKEVAFSETPKEGLIVPLDLRSVVIVPCNEVAFSAIPKEGLMVPLDSAVRVSLEYEIPCKEVAFSATPEEGLMVPLDLRSVVIVAFQPLRACPKYSPADAEGLYLEE